MNSRAKQRIEAPNRRAAVGLGVASWQWDLESDEFYYSDEWKRIRGLSDAEITNTPTERVSRVHPDDVADLERHRAALIRGERESYECDHRVRHHGGSWIWIAERCRAVREDGKAVSLVGCDFEITKRKHEELELRQHGVLADAIPAKNDNAKEQLEHKQALLAATLEATPDFVGMVNSKREILWHNKAFTNMHPDLGTPGEMLAIEKLHPDWALKIIEEVGFPTAMKHGSWSGETAVLDMDGNEIPVSQLILAHKTPNGELESFSTVMRDISERKKTEQALRDSERMFAGLASAAPAGIFRMSGANNCVYVNPRWGEITGRPIEEALGEGWMSCMHPDDLPLRHKNTQGFLKDDSRTVNGPWESRVVLPDGSLRRVQVHVAKEQDESGNVIGLVGTITDVESVRVAEDHLKQVNERLRRVLECSSIGFWEWSHEDERLTWDDQMLKIHGVDAADFRGVYDDWSDRLHPDDFDRMMSRDKCRGELEGSSEDYFRIVRPDGEVRHIYSNVSVERNEQGEPLRTTGINMDITDRRVAELALSQSQDKFQRIVEGVAEVIWSADCKGALTYLSPRFESMFGLNPADWIGKLPFDLMHPDDRCDLEPSVKVQLEEGSTRKNEEFRHLCADGTYVWVALTAAPVMDEEGRITGFHGVIRDISQSKAAEVALLESETKFQRVAEHVPGMFFRYIVHPDGTDELAYVSSGVRDIFGVEPEDAIGSGVSKVWGQIQNDDREKLAKAVAVSAKKLTPLIAEYRLDFPDGFRYVQTYAQPFRTEGGDVVWDGVVLDNSERKSAQLALQESQGHLQRMTANIPGMIYRFVLDKDGNNFFTYVSPQSSEFFGFEPQELIDDVERTWRWIHPSDLPRVQQSIVDSAENLTPYDEEFRVNLPDQETRWYQVYGHPARADNGDVIWDGIVLDRTKRKAIEGAFNDTQSQFQRITENIPGMIYRYVLKSDGSQVMPYVGGRCRELYEVEPAAAMKNAELLYERIHPEDIAEIRELSRVTIETLQPSKADYRVVLPEQGVRWLRTMCKPSRNDDGEFVADGVTFDITDRKQAELDLQRANEELEIATKMKDEFLATMSHELRTPLNAILSTNGGLREGIFGPVSQDQMESYDVIAQSGRHLLDLINEVLDLAKLDSGAKELQISAVDVKELCESSLKLVTQQAEQKNIELNLRVPFNLPNLAADEKRIRQILVNLLSNAVKFTPDGGTVSLEIQRQRSEDACHDDHLHITVSDTGIGIAPEDLDSLFEPFVQLDSSLSRNYEGTGLGLALVERFVKLHGGVVTVSSEVDVGSRFAVDFPYRQVSDTDVSQSEPPQQTDPEDRSSGRVLDDSANAVILLAEDNEMAIRATIKYLESRGYQVIHASNGQAAVEFVRKSTPDLILMDVQMPVMDGLEATQHIRAMPHGKNIPIIALTGMAMPDDEARCIRAGANGYLSKPYRLQALMDSIANLLPGKTKP